MQTEYKTSFCVWCDQYS